MATFIYMNPKPEQALSSIQVVNSKSHEAANNIWHMWLYHSIPSGCSILFKRLPFNFRTWVCFCVATTTVQRTDKTGGYPRRVCRVSAVIVHAMTVAILWTVFSKTAGPSVGYVVLNSFQHHLFPPNNLCGVQPAAKGVRWPGNCEIGVSSARLDKAQSSGMASNCS